MVKKTFPDIQWLLTNVIWKLLMPFLELPTTIVELKMICVHSVPRLRTFAD